MRRVRIPRYPDGTVEPEDLQEFTLVDGNATIEGALDQVDDLLVPFGLEVVMPDADAYDGDDVLFTIRRRQRRGR
jgi:hypothetical protein